jgi:transcriptional regulator with XRE-family HTH domain
MRTNLPRAVRALRLRRGWRQEELGARSGLSRQVISRIERDEIEGVTVVSLDRVTRALGATLDLRAYWQGAELDRLIDARHAEIQDDQARFLRSVDWETRAEVSFNHYGDRGRVDLVARHASLGYLLIVEIKTEIGDLQELLGHLDVKVRLAPTIAAELGWRATAVIPALVFASSRPTRQIIAEHDALFARFAVRGRSAIAWLRHPTQPVPSGLLCYVSRPDSRGVSVRSRKRITKPTDSREV